jgi:carbon monoxide dehydrogenase subunit G
VKFEQSFAVAHPPARVWAALHDVEAVARCLPGAEVTEVGEGGALKGRMNVRFGPIAAAFAGEGRLEMDDAGRTGRIAGSGLDRQSRSQARGSVDFSLREADGGTRVELAVDYTLTGSLAQFSRGGLVADLAGRLAQEFARNLEARLNAEAAAAPAAETPAAPEPPPAAAALNAGGLLGAVLWARIKAFLHRLFGR